MLSFLYLVIGFGIGLLLTGSNQPNSKNSFQIVPEKILIEMISVHKLEHYRPTQMTKNTPLVSFHSLSVYYNYAYAKNFGYGFLRLNIFHKRDDPNYFDPIFENDGNFQRYFDWDVFPATYYLFQKTDYDIVVYISENAIFGDFQTRIETLVEKQKSHLQNVSLIIGSKKGDLGKNLDPRMMIFFKNEKTLKFLSEWYNTPFRKEEWKEYVGVNGLEKALNEVIYPNYKNDIIVIPSVFGNGDNEGNSLMENYLLEENNLVVNQLISSLAIHLRNSYSRQIGKFQLNPEVFCPEFNSEDETEPEIKSQYEFQARLKAKFELEKKKR
ncbi:hypothetical protein M0811_04227 [Anaeramoeba ignava]|uniref:Uncharacterized protein n=1 Tax=Anaeramoeba ignava TaxID=1746090 RepID=A0A9Q0LSR6_ANAIG|nr:hypothetical protein M0811_04227 [Anaeramoeba ignava]